MNTLASATSEHDLVGSQCAPWAVPEPSAAFAAKVRAELALAEVRALEALRISGTRLVFNYEPLLPRVRARFRRGWTKDELLACIHEFVREYGYVPTSRDFQFSQGKKRPGVQTYARHFGNWGNAIVEAGFPRPVKGNRKRS